MTQRFRFSPRPVVCLLLAAICLMTRALPALEVKLPRIPQPPTVAPPTAPTIPDAPARPMSPAEIWLQEAESELRKAQEASRAAAEKEPQETLPELIEKLLNEFGPDARYGVTQHFIVIYDTTDSYAYWCATLLEKVARTYARFVSYASFVDDGKYDPMIVVIFSKKEDYEAYLKKVGGSEFANAENLPVGAYALHVNRAIFYDMTGEERKKVANKEGDKRTVEEVAKEVLANPDGPDNISTVIHEGTHQVSYNFGLFSRTGQNPAWATEGLAMLFGMQSGDEKDGGWKVVDEKAKTITFPINEPYLRLFQLYVKTTTDEQPVKKCVGLEKIRGEEPCAYPVSWALFYYLYLYYPKQLGEYLANSAMMQPRLDYSERERVYEFMEFFGDDWDGMYLELRAFADGLELELTGVPRNEAQARARKAHNLPELPTAVKKQSKRGQRKTSETPKRDRQKAAAEPDANAANADAKPADSDAPASDDAKAPENKKGAPAKKAEPTKKEGKKTEPAKKNAAGSAADSDDDWLDAWDGEKPN